MTKIGVLIRERKVSYAAVAARAHLQARTVRQIANGEKELDRVELGTLRRIAEALSVPVSALLEDETIHPGDASVPRGERLAKAVRMVMWPSAPLPYPSPLELGPRDEVADLTPDDFFTAMKPIDAVRG